MDINKEESILHNLKKGQGKHGLCCGGEPVLSGLIREHANDEDKWRRYARLTLVFFGGISAVGN